MRRRRYLTGIGTGVGVLVLAGGDHSTVVAQERSVSIVATNDPVEAGDWLDVTVEIENASDSRARPAIEFLVGGDRQFTRITTVGAGETETLEFSHRTYPVLQDVSVPVTVDVGDDSDERTVDVYGIEELDDGNRSPDGDLTVQPGTTVHFEVESDALGEYGGVTHWYLDDAYSGWSSGPWYAAYYAHRGTDYWHHTFESDGTYGVRAAIDGEDANYATRWTVEVATDGVAGPIVEDANPSPGPLDVSRDETLDLSVDVASPDGSLDEVVWWLGHADVVLGSTDVDGTEDTASISIDRFCHTCPIVVWVRDESGTVTSEDLWTAQVSGGDARVRIVDVNDPVEAGDELTVVAELENTGGSEIEEELELVVGDEVVDTEAVTVDVGATATVTLGYETYPVERDVEFPVTVRGDADRDTRTVEVVAELGPTRITILDANDPVEAGAFLEVVAEVENVDDTTASDDIHLVAGDRVDTRSVELEPGESEEIELGYETYPVEVDVEFPITVHGDGGSDSRIVEVFADGVPSFAVAIVGTNDPVEASEFLAVTAEIENVDDETVTQDVHLDVGGDRVDTESVTLDPGETTEIELGYDTYPVERDVEFPVTVVSDGVSDERVVEVVADDDDDELDVEFVDCTRVEITGSFEDGDSVWANTAYNTDLGVGTTTGEDGLVVGEDVEAPLIGTIVFEVGDDGGVSEDADGATVTVSDRGAFGTTITGIMGPDARGAETTHLNPHDCGAEIMPERPTLAVETVESVDGETFAVTFEYENPNDVSMHVESEFVSGTTADEPPTELESGSHSFTVEWTPESDDERLGWEVDLRGFGDEDPVYTETEPAGEYRADGTFDVTIVETNSPVVAGETLEVEAEFENTGEQALTQDGHLVVGDERTDTVSVTAGPGETTTITLGYDTFPVEQDVTFTVRVESENDADERTVDVLAAAETDPIEDPEDDDPPAGDEPPDDSDPPDDGDEPPDDGSPPDEGDDPPDGDEPRDDSDSPDDGDGSSDDDPSTDDSYGLL